MLVFLRAKIFQAILAPYNLGNLVSNKKTVKQLNSKSLKD